MTTHTRFIFAFQIPQTERTAVAVGAIAGWCDVIVRWEGIYFVGVFIKLCKVYMWVNESQYTEGCDQCRESDGTGKVVKLHSKKLDNEARKLKMELT